MIPLGNGINERNYQVCKDAKHAQDAEHAPDTLGTHCLCGLNLEANHRFLPVQ
jgi:hypothetical protein